MIDLDLLGHSPVNEHLCSPSACELFGELNYYLANGAPVEEVISFVKESNWQQELSSGEDTGLKMEIVSGSDIIAEI